MCVKSIAALISTPLPVQATLPSSPETVVNLPGAQLPEMQLQLPRKPLEGTEEEDRSKVCLVFQKCYVCDQSCWSDTVCLATP